MVQDAQKLQQRLVQQAHVVQQSMQQLQQSIQQLHQAQKLVVRQA
jgi:hypothetical protein